MNSMNIVEVKFDYSKQTNFFRNNKFNLKNNITVIVDSDRGLQFGKVVNIIDDISEFDSVSLFNVVRIATKKDYLKHVANMNDVCSAIIKCKELVKKNNLPMTILDGSYNFDRTQLLFRFVAEERVDFRNLAKELGSCFKTRIELRQVGIRDKAKEIGGVGPCGRLLCCSSFLNSFDSVTISMAKNQNVSLNPTKINGVCGRLLCCLRYENDTYSDLKKDLPKLGSVVDYEGKEGKVISFDVLKGKYKLQFNDKSVLEVSADDSKK